MTLNYQVIVKRQAISERSGWQFASLYEIFSMLDKKTNTHTHTHTG